MSGALGRNADIHGERRPEPVPERTHAPISQRAISAVVWLLIVVFSGVVWALIMSGGLAFITWAAGFVEWLAGGAL